VVNVLLGLYLLFYGYKIKERAAKIPVWGISAGMIIIVAALFGGNVFLTVHEHHITHFLTKKLGYKRAQNNLIYYKEGTTGNVSVVELQRTKNRFLLVNSIFISGMDINTKLMGHLPCLLHPDPRSALVICFGQGTSFRSLAAHGIEVQGVELVPEEIETFPLFYENAPKFLRDSRYQIEINDGRNHLLLTRKKYDVITVDPSPPIYSSGAVNLYTPEFYRLCRERLSPRGVLCMWFFLPSCRTAEFQMLLKSFMTVFPDATIWKSPTAYGVFGIGTKEKLRIDGETLRLRIQNQAVQNDVKGSLQKDVTFDENYLFDLFMFNSRTAWEMVRDGPDLSDDKPYIENPLVTWWLYPGRLDFRKVFLKKKDDLRDYLTPSAVQ